MATELPITLNKAQTEAFVKYFEDIQAVQSSFYNYKAVMEAVDIAYHRETIGDEETVQAELAKLKGDVKKIRNIEIPLVKPQVESAVTYLTSVFLTGYPIFGITSGPHNIDTALQWNTLMIDHSHRGKWVKNLQMFFRDGVKYNLHGLHVYWDKQTVYSPETVASEREAQRREVIWQGNVIRRLDMYNTFFDPRVPPSEVYSQGEYAGYHEVVSRIELKKRIQQLPVQFNLVHAYNSPFNTDLYYFPSINGRVFNQDVLNKGSTNWVAWFSGNMSNSSKIQFNWNSSYVLTTLYCRIIPADFGIFNKAKLTPQIWKLLIVNGKYPIYAERLSNLHDYLPIIIGQPFEDGLGLQTKSLAMDVIPFQDVASALWSSRMHAARRRISDRMIYNKNVIDKRDIEKPDASAKIPARLPAYNSDIRAAVYHIPFEDTASATFAQEVSTLAEFSFYASGQNRVQQGQFQRGNKTLEEFNTVMQNANGRNQTLALFIEDQVFTPMKEMLKLNIMQYQGETTLYNPQEDREIKINPKDLREHAAIFKVSDGLLPVSKLMGTDEFTVALQVIGSSPALQQEYKMASLFSYLMKLRGAEGLDKFEYSEAEKLYRQQLASWQQVAIEAIKLGQQPPPQPAPPAEIQQQLQEEQMRNATGSPVENTAL